MSEQPHTPSRVVRLGDGVVASVVLAPVKLTTLQVPATVARERLSGPTVTRTRSQPTPTLVGKAVLPAGSSGGSPVDDGVLIGGARRYRQRTPSASWYFVHPLGRIPNVDLYVHRAGGSTDDDLELVEADPEVRSTYIAVEWPTPQTGVVLLT